MKIDNKLQPKLQPRVALILILSLAAQALQANEYEADNDECNEEVIIIDDFTNGNISFHPDSVEYHHRNREFFYDQQTGQPIDRLGILDFEELLMRKYTQIWKNRAGYFYFSFVLQNITLEDVSYPDIAHEVVRSFKFSDKFAFGAGLGRTFYIIPPRRPLFGCLRIGFDLTFFDANIAELKYQKADELANIPSYNTLRYFLFDIGAFHYGPSITINPFGKTKLAGYMHWNPTYSMLLVGPRISSKVYQSRSWGISIVLNSIGIGFERRWGNCQHEVLDPLVEMPKVEARKTTFAADGLKAHTQLTMEQTAFYINLRF